MQIKLSSINVAWQPSAGPASSGGGAQLGRRCEGGLGIRVVAKRDAVLVESRVVQPAWKPGSAVAACRKVRGAAWLGEAAMQWCAVGGGEGKGARWVVGYIDVGAEGGCVSGNRRLIQGRHSASGPAARPAPKRAARHAGRLTAGHHAKRQARPGGALTHMHCPWCCCGHARFERLPCVRPPPAAGRRSRRLRQSGGQSRGRGRPASLRARRSPDVGEGRGG